MLEGNRPLFIAAILFIVVIFLSIMIVHSLIEVGIKIDEHFHHHPKSESGCFSPTTTEVINALSGKPMGRAREVMEMSDEEFDAITAPAR